MSERKFSKESKEQLKLSLEKSRYLFLEPQVEISRDVAIKRSQEGNMPEFLQS